LKNFGILGGGFGLYGYLPAGFNNGLNILTLEKYQDFILSRADIKHFFNKIQFYKRNEEVIDKSDILVIARRPADQEEIINKINNGKDLILEKPIAQTHNVASEIINKLTQKGFNYRIGFTFLETTWYRELKKFYKTNIANVTNFGIKWSFQANHYKMNSMNWKRNINEGGGVFNFFGCHILSLLASIDDWEINDIDSFFYNDCDEFKFDLEAESNKGVKCTSRCNSNSFNDPVFEINIFTKTGKKYNYKSKDPFDYLIKNNNLLDHRIPLLERIINSFNDDKISYTNLYKKYVELRMQSEPKRVIHIIK